MPKRFVFLGSSFLIISVLAGVFGLIYFGGNNNRTEESSTSISPQPATATSVIVDDNSAGPVATSEPSITPTVTPETTATPANTPVNQRTATSRAYQTQIPLTNTALYEVYTGTQTALEQMATSTAGAAATPTEANP